MPTYDYACEGCGGRFEAFQTITANPLEVCSLCQKGPVKRLISGGAGLIFKGTGFYCTDYKGTKQEKPVDAKPSEHKPADPAKATEPKTYKKD